MRKERTEITLTMSVLDTITLVTKELNPIHEIVFNIAHTSVKLLCNI